MKILFVIPFMGCGGAEILLGNISRSLIKKGHNVKIATIFPFDKSWDNYPDKEEFLKEVPLVDVGGSVSFRFLKQPEIDNQKFKELITAFSPDIVHSHLFLAELLSHSFLSNKAVYISHGHDNMPQLIRPGIKSLLNKKKLTNLWERSWLIKQYKKCNNHFIAISRDVEHFLKENLTDFSDNITYLPNAINTAKFETERDYGVHPGSPFHIVSIANLVEKKNHIFLIDVMKILVDKGYDVTLDVLGSGPLMEMLTKKTAEANLQNRLIFRGSVGEIPQRLREANLYVHPAKYEPFGLVFLEAMATGLPAVALDGYGNRELISEGLNGFMLPNDASPEAFAEKIIYLINNPGEIQRMGMFAKDFSREYDIEIYTDRLVSLYQHAIDHKLDNS